MDELLPKVDNWYEFLSVHKDMLEDDIRVSLYKQAIRSCVHQGDTVVDVGTGTGILAFLAVQAGASIVYAIESANIIKLARQVAEVNGMSGRIKFIQSDSRLTDLPEKVDLLVSEVIGHCVLEENILDAMIDARRRFLKADGQMIPKLMDMYFVPIQDDETYDYMSFWRGSVEGIDFSPAWKKMTNNIYVDRYDSSCYMADPGVLLSIDLTTVDQINIKGSLDFRCFKDGVVHGFISWFKAMLSDGVILSTSPEDPPTHWQSSYFPLETPLRVKSGEILHFECACASVSESTSWKWSGMVMDSEKNIRATFSHSTEGYWQ